MESTQSRSSTGAPEAIWPFGPNAWIWLLTAVVLVGGLFVGGTYALKFARVAQAKSAIKGLSIAINGYETEYHRDPSLGQKLGLVEGRNHTVAGDLLNILMGLPTAYNPRKIRFYDPPTARGSKNGAWIDASGHAHLNDPWGNSYFWRADVEGDRLIPDPEIPGSFISTLHIVYSAGPDGEHESWDDNVASWK